MKNLSSSVLLLSALSFASFPTNAEQGWVFNSKVSKIVVTFDGGINVRLSPDLAGCTSQSGYGPSYASLYHDHPGKNQILSILLAANMSDKPVAIYLMDGTCKIGEVLLGEKY